MSGSSSMMSTGLGIFTSKRFSNVQTSVRMFDDGGLGHVNGQLADVRDVVGDALYVFGDEQQARGARRGRRVCDHQVDEIVKDAIVEIVYLVVALDDGARRPGIAGSESIERGAQHARGVFGHARPGDEGLKLRLVVQAYGDACDVAGVVGDAFEDGRDLAHGDDEAQVTRGRLPQRNRIYAEPVDLDFEPVYRIVLKEHFTGGL